MQMSSLWRALLPGSVIVGFIVFLSSYAGAKKFALKDGGYQIDASKELSALGLANLVGSCFGAVPVQVGLSRMAVGYDAGVQTVWGSNIIVAVVVVLLSLLFTPLFYYIPQSTMSAIIISGAYGLFDFNIVRYLWNMEDTLVKRRGWWIHMSGFFGTLLVGCCQGILIPGLLSIMLLIHDSTKLKVRELGKMPKSNMWRTKDTWPTAKTIPKILVLRLEGNLSFSNADTLFELVTKAVKNAGGMGHEDGGMELEALVLDMGNVSLCDFSAIAILEEMAGGWRQRHKWMIVCGARDSIRAKLERLLMPLIPNPSLLLTTQDAVTLAQALISGAADNTVPASRVSGVLSRRSSVNQQREDNTTDASTSQEVALNMDNYRGSPNRELAGEVNIASSPPSILNTGSGAMNTVQRVHSSPKTLKSFVLRQRSFDTDNATNAERLQQHFQRLEWRHTRTLDYFKTEHLEKSVRLDPDLINVGFDCEGSDDDDDDEYLLDRSRGIQRQRSGMITPKN
ncbi:unnamed protein product [Amoebophrya sp. A25]|nr:unnamed protein product [Amoebophrya sp. A25]|eukprot:GSA25T00006345001.1